ncbi:MAG: hypothetical protein KBD01_11345 [Acidobacteria bacterium]|nr:hypothetical protein [Acidobacteriota bacterium]
MASGPARGISRGERLVLAGAVLLFVALVFAPVVQGFRQALPDSRFLGFVGGYRLDYHGYFAWIRQAEDGHFLFRDMFTSEPHARVLFLPLFWLMGTLAKWTGLAPLAVWYALHALGCAAMLVSAYRLFAEFTGDRRARLLALALCAGAAGLGWATGQARGAPDPSHAIDLWAVEASLLHGGLSLFLTLPIGLALMLESLRAFHRYLDGGRLRDAALGGLWALLMSAVHLYEIPIVLAVALSWTLLSGMRRLPGLALFGALAVPYAAYGFGVTRLDPVLSRLGWDIVPPSIPATLLGLAPLLLPAAIAVAAPFVRRAHRGVWLLAAWVVIGLVATHLPVGFTVKHVWGLQVPLALLGALLFSALLERAAAAGAGALLGARAAVAVVLVAGVIGAGAQLVAMLNQPARHSPGDYLPRDNDAALLWIDEHGGDGDVVLASRLVAVLVPGRTGLTVFEGHGAQTIERARKLEFVQMLFGPPERADLGAIARILARNRVRYVLLDRWSAEHAYGAAWRGTRFAFEPLCPEVFRNERTIVWERRDHRPADETAYWPTGDWRGP